MPKTEVVPASPPPGFEKIGTVGPGVTLENVKLVRPDLRERFELLLAPAQKVTFGDPERPPEPLPEVQILLGKPKAETKNLDAA